jgi:hypothetical protein
MNIVQQLRRCQGDITVPETGIIQQALLSSWFGNARIGAVLNAGGLRLSLEAIHYGFYGLGLVGLKLEFEFHITKHVISVAGFQAPALLIIHMFVKARHSGRYRLARLKASDI